MIRVSGNAIFAGRVTWKYAYSPFNHLKMLPAAKISLFNSIISISALWSRYWELSIVDSPYFHILNSWCNENKKIVEWKDDLKSIADCISCCLKHAVLIVTYWITYKVKWIFFTLQLHTEQLLCPIFIRLFKSHNLNLNIVFLFQSFLVLTALVTLFVTLCV